MKNLLFAPAVFLVAYCCAYVLVLVQHWPLFYYHPQTLEFSWGWQKAQSIGPKMAWYGMMASASMAALLAALVIRDESVLRPLRDHPWVYPVAAMLIVTFQMRNHFV
jgi:hypothetical protein